VGRQFPAVEARPRGTATDHDHRDPRARRRHWGLSHTTPLNAGIIGAASPILVAIGSWVVLGDRLSRANWAGVALSVLAVLVTVAKGSVAVLLTLGGNRGDLIVLASSGRSGRPAPRRSSTSCRSW
jgi:hypothetical protein